jgi:hypothetical protein
LARTQPTQDVKTGKFTGSIGAGRDQVPTAATGLPVTVHTAPAGADTIIDTYSAYQARQATQAPLEAATALTGIEANSLDIAERLLDLGDAETHARSALTEAGNFEAEQIADQSRRLFADVVRARQELRNARAALQGDYISPPAGSALAVEAELLSLEANTTARLLAAQAHSDDPEAIARMSDAQRHIAKAHGLLAPASDPQR